MIKHKWLFGGMAITANYLICATFTRLYNNLTNNALLIITNYASIQ